ncbi:hypothetical protein Hanom_Chr09g00771721 [Helianthus anomalus]
MSSFFYSRQLPSVASPPPHPVHRLLQATLHSVPPLLLVFLLRRKPTDINKMISNLLRI